MNTDRPKMLGAIHVKVNAFNIRVLHQFYARSIPDLQIGFMKNETSDSSYARGIFLTFSMKNIEWYKIANCTGLSKDAAVFWLDEKTTEQLRIFLNEHAQPTQTTLKLPINPSNP